MSLYQLLLLAVLLVIQTSCFNQEQPATSLEFSQRTAGANSAAAFRNTVHPLLVKNCGTCHGDGGINIKHAVSDYQEAHDVVVDGGKVDFSNAANSRLVVKLSDQQHNCWSSNCSDDAAEMLEAIEEWIELRGAALVVDGAKTANLKYKDARTRNPETIFGTIVMQAEDGNLIGRFKSKTNSQASNYKYISGDDAPIHPIEQTLRNITVDSSCGPFPQGEIDRFNTAYNSQQANGTGDYRNGRVEMSERRRHVNQYGHRYYSQRVRFKIIRPSMRAAYKTAIANGVTSLGALDQYFLKEGAPDEDNPAILTGDDIEGTNTIRVLPNFVSEAYYESNIENLADANADNNLPAPLNSIAGRDFFAPRFGNPAIEYFVPTSEEIRENLDPAIKQAMVYDAVYDRYRNFFYDGGPGTWNDQNNLDETPFSLRTYNNGSLQIFQANNIASSDQFFAYFLGGLTRANAITTSVENGETFHRIDEYVHYYVDPNDRSTNNFNVDKFVDDNGTPVDPYDDNYDRDTFNLKQNENVELNLVALLQDASSVDGRSISASNYATTLYPILRANCVSCHGDGSGRPQFAGNSTLDAYDAVANFINFTVPGNSRPATRMDEGHNCGARCAQIKSDMEAAIAAWNTQNLADVAAAQSAAAPTPRPLTLREVMPGRAEYNITVREAGDYTIWLKTLDTDGGNGFRVSLQDSNGNMVQKCRANQTCLGTTSSYNTGDGSGNGCLQFNPDADNGIWEWYTRNQNDVDRRFKWSLDEGNYKIIVHETGDVGSKLDLVAISANPEFNPAENLIDEGLISSARPRILRFDLQQHLRSPGFFEIEIIEKNGGDSYAFRNPRIVGNTRRIKVKNIKVMVNDKYEFTDSSYTKINRVVGTEGKIMTYAPLIALSINGTGSDTFKFVFEDLKVTNAPVTVDVNDEPVPVVGRKCNELDLFKNSVFPILNEFRLIRKSDNNDDSYLEFTADDRLSPGRDRNGGSNPTFYTCTTCHNEDHPYFKMTTFFDANGPTDEQLALLCEQALSRANLDNFERSLILRGINGTFNHPKLHFVENVNTSGTSSGGNRGFRFRTNANRPNGWDTPTGENQGFVGFRFAKYTQDFSGAPDPGEVYVDPGLSAAQQTYLRKFIGQYQRIGYTRINDPLTRRNGQIRLPGDNSNGNPGALDGDTWTYAGNGLNMHFILQPNNFVNRMGDMDPDSMDDGGVLRIKDSCLDRSFASVNGQDVDPCNGNIPVRNEFEVIKTKYRDAIINWMEAEKNAL